MYIYMYDYVYIMTTAIINEAVPKSSDDYLLAPEESYRLGFEKRVQTVDGIKIARVSFDIGHTQFLEIIQKYGLNPASKWVVWDKTMKKNVSYVEK